MLRKYILLFIFIGLFIGETKAQSNLVPNGSFENYSSCPTTLDQMSNCTSWSSYGWTPDYFNSCSSTNGIAPPYSAFGYQVPLYGNAYAGLATYDNTGTSPNYREIIGAQLITALQTGTKYYFSFFVSFGGAQSLTLATDKIGLNFSSVPYSKTNSAPINNYSIYYSNSIISDSTNWLQLKGSFISDSAYQYIMIGNFFNDANTDTLGTGQFNLASYYYVDNVCLSTDSNYAFNSSIFRYDDPPEISIYPVPLSNGLINIKLEHNSFENIEVFDNLGVLLYEKKIPFNSSLISCDITFLNSGSYFLKTESKGQVFYKQFIISKQD